MGKVTQLVTVLAEEIAVRLGFELWDVEYVKEGGARYLRVFIDCEGGININQCEEFSNALEEKLDELDPIEESYILEISSPGIERELKRESDFLRYIGSLVTVRLYKPEHNARVHEGTLVSYGKDGLTIEQPGGEPVTFALSSLAKVNLRCP